MQFDKLTVCLSWVLAQRWETDESAGACCRESEAEVGVKCGGGQGGAVS